MYRLTIIIFVLWMLAGCEDEPVLNINPQILLVETSSDSIVQFQDSLVLGIYYEDGDGNLGFENPDSFALEVWDTRLSDPDLYFIPPLAPPEAQVAITGTLDVTINSVFLLGNGGAETTTFELRIKDRTGNWSNTIRTDPIIITRN